MRSDEYIGTRLVMILNGYINMFDNNFGYMEKVKMVGALVTLVMLCVSCSTNEVSIMPVQRCPQCDSYEISEVIYGFVGNCDSITEAKIKDSRIILGGCCVSKDSPKYVCRTCKHEWGSALW